MGGWAARKAVMVVENVEIVLAIELLAACQAIDFLRPLKSTAVLEAVHALVRTKVPFLEADRYLKVPRFLFCRTNPTLSPTLTQSVT
jgi:histidine ammonia-lyase